MIIPIYVDHFLIYNAQKKAINRFKDALKTKYYMSDLRLISFYLGIAVSQNRENKIVCFSQ